MKKLVYVFALVASVASFVSCSSDSDGGNAINVDGQSLKINNNNGALVYNTTSLDAGTETSTRYFSMIVGNLTTTDFPDYVDVEVTYNNTAGINGTYTLTNSSTTAGTADVDYYNADNDFESNNGQGSVKVTDLGNNKFKLEFTNVTVTDNSDPAATLSVIVKGSVTATFGAE